MPIENRNCHANQLKYEKKTVGQVLKAAGLEIVKLVRLKVGEVTL